MAASGLRMDPSRRPVDDAQPDTMLPVLARSGARLGGGLQGGGYVIHRVELASGCVHDQIVGGVVGQREPVPVHAVEGEGQPLVAIDQGAVAGQ